MYYMIEVGYQKVLLETDRLVPDSVFAVSLKTVDGVAMYVTESTPDVSVHLIPGRKIIFPGTKEEQDCFRNLYAEIEKDRDEYRSRAWKAEDEIKKLRKEKESKDD
jgi:hypothetical protein